MYKGIANTYLVGKSGPTIYDLEVFPYSTIKGNEKPSQLSKHPKFNAYKLNNTEKEFVSDSKTKALLVYKNDSLLYEQYWDGHSENTVSNSFSAVKTMVAMLVGIAIEEGHIKSMEDKVGDYLPEFNSSGKEDITIHHLLTMSSGLDWTESAKNPFSNNAESYYGENLHELVTHQKVESEPGKIFKYQSGNTQLLGFVIEKATGMGLSDYAESRIWTKIGAEHDAFWSLDKVDGDEKSFCCLYVTPADYARLGMLMLNKGKFNGNQVIPVDYFAEMTKPAPLMTEEGIPNYRYGLQTWIYIDNESQINYFRGAKGQYVITIPDEDLVIVRLGSSKKPNFILDETKIDEGAYFEENKFKVGHSPTFFKFIDLGRKIKEKTSL